MSTTTETTGNDTTVYSSSPPPTLSSSPPITTTNSTSGDPNATPTESDDLVWMYTTIGVVAAVVVILTIVIIIVICRWRKKKRRRPPPTLPDPHAHYYPADRHGPGGLERAESVSCMYLIAGGTPGHDCEDSGGLTNKAHDDTPEESPASLSIQQRVKHTGVQIFPTAKKVAMSPPKDHTLEEQSYPKEESPDSPEYASANAGDSNINTVKLDSQKYLKPKPGAKSLRPFDVKKKIALVPKAPSEPQICQINKSEDSNTNPASKKYKWVNRKPLIHSPDPTENNEPPEYFDMAKHPINRMPSTPPSPPSPVQQQRKNSRDDVFKFPKVSGTGSPQPCKGPIQRGYVNMQDPNLCFTPSKSPSSAAREDVRDITPQPVYQNDDSVENEPVTAGGSLYQNVDKAMQDDGDSSTEPDTDEKSQTSQTDIYVVPDGEMLEENWYGNVNGSQQSPAYVKASGPVPSPEPKPKPPKTDRKLKSTEKGKTKAGARGNGEHEAFIGDSNSDKNEKPSSPNIDTYGVSFLHSNGAVGESKNPTSPNMKLKNDSAKLSASTPQLPHAASYAIDIPSVKHHHNKPKSNTRGKQQKSPDAHYEDQRGVYGNLSPTGEPLASPEIPHSTSFEKHSKSPRFGGSTSELDKNHMFNISELKSKLKKVK